MKKKVVDAVLSENGMFLMKLRQVIIVKASQNRSIREFAIKGLKQLCKVSKQICEMFIQRKCHYLVTFILEREFKFAVVAKERLQCFKLIRAFLKKKPAIFPMLFA